MQIGYVYIRPVEALYVRALGPYKTAAASAWSDMLAWLDERRLRGQIARGFGIINDDPQTTPSRPAGATTLASRRSRAWMWMRLRELVA